MSETAVVVAELAIVSKFMLFALRKSTVCLKMKGTCTVKIWNTQLSPKVTTWITHTFLAQSRKLRQTFCYWTPWIIIPTKTCENYPKKHETFFGSLKKCTFICFSWIGIVSANVWNLLKNNKIFPKNLGTFLFSNWVSQNQWSLVKTPKTKTQTSNLNLFKTELLQKLLEEHRERIRKYFNFSSIPKFQVLRKMNLLKDVLK